MSRTRSARSRHTGRLRRAGALTAAALVAAATLAADARPARAQTTTARVDSLLERGRLQEAAWAARAAGDSARADRILDRLEAILTARPSQARPQGTDSQGVSYTFRLQHTDGVESIFKLEGSDIFCPGCGPDREIATYRVDRLLGLDLTPMTVPTWIVDPAGDTLTGSAMYFVHGASLPSEVGAEKPDRLRFLDAVIGNSDRHRANWLVLPDGRPVAIDHNRAFQYRPTSKPKSCWETEVDSLARPDGLGRPFQRYRSLPDDSLAAAVAPLSPELVARFVAMRPRVVARIEARAAEPERHLPLDDCAFPR